MEAKLIRVIRKVDNNNSSKELARYFKDVQLLIGPQLNTRIITGKIEFFIDELSQDLNSKIIYLYEYKDIHYLYDHDFGEFKKERDILSNSDWKLCDAPAGFK